MVSLCIHNFIENFVPEKTIVGNNSNKKYNLVCREWFTHLNDENIKRNTLPNKKIQMNVILIITKQERNNPHIMIWKNILLEMVMMMILKLCINSKVVFDMVIESATHNLKLDMIKQWTKSIIQKMMVIK